MRAAEVAGVTRREDFRAALRSVFISKYEHRIVFDQAFNIFWKRRGFMEKLIAMMSPVAEPQKEDEPVQKPKAGATRVAQALLPRKEPEQQTELEIDQRFTMSASEVLQKKDFAQMTAEELSAATLAIQRLKLSDDEILHAAFCCRLAWPADRSAPHLPAIAARAGADRTGEAHAPDAPSARRGDLRHLWIDGGLHTCFPAPLFSCITEKRRRVHTFLFGTRLSNVTRALRHKDPDEALALCTAEVEDWSGGTRIGACLHRFNRDWSRRVLGQGAIVLLFTDGLEREGTLELAREIEEHLRESARRVIWLNPLLRYDRFEPLAQGIRAMLSEVDEFRPVHNLSSIAALADALSAKKRDARPIRNCGCAPGRLDSCCAAVLATCDRRRLLIFVRTTRRRSIEAGGFDEKSGAPYGVDRRCLPAVRRGWRPTELSATQRALCAAVQPDGHRSFGAIAGRQAADEMGQGRRRREQARRRRPDRHSRRAADDHVLLYASSASLIAHPYTLPSKPPYEIGKDLLPIVRTTDTILAVAVPESMQVRTLGEFVLCKEKSRQGQSGRRAGRSRFRRRGPDQGARSRCDARALQGYRRGGTVFAEGRFNSCIRPTSWRALMFRRARCAC